MNLEPTPPEPIAIPCDLEGMYLKAMAESDSGMVIFPIGDGVTRGNVVAAEFLGYQLDELSGVQLEDITHHADASFYQENNRALLEGRSPFYQGEKRFIRKDHAVVWGRIMVSLVRDGENRPRYFFAKLDRGLHQSEERWRFALECSEQGIYDRDYVRNRVFYSAGYLRNLGYEVGEWSNSPLEWTTRIHPDDYDRVLGADTAHFDGKTRAVEVEYRLRAKDASYRWIHDRGKVVQWDANGGHVRMIGTHIDITERKRAEEKLEESEELFRSVMESSTVGMIIEEINGVRVKGNAAMARFFGYTEEEFANVTPFDVSYPEDIPELRERRAELISGKVAFFQRERRYIHKNGHTIWGLLNVTLMCDATGQAKYLISQLPDITERKLAEEELRATKELAEAASRAKSEFLAMMSHEIRTPMNGILGYAELLRSTRIDAEQLDYVSTIAGSGRALLRIIDDILDFSRIESGQVVLDEVEFQPGALVREVAALLAPQAASKGIEIQTEIDDRCLEVRGDQGRVRQVLINLAGNAVKFTSEGFVSLGLRVGAISGGRVALEFTVRDTGEGIAEEKVREIFEPFRQADSSVTRKYGGTGLGLAISRRFVELMGGSLTVESAPGAGSCFTCTLEFALVEKVVPTEKRTAAFDESFALRYPLRILVAEDDATNRKLIERVLRKFGYSALLAQQGREAVELYRREKPDCILMDMQMAEMDGLEATRRIRLHEQAAGGRRVYILALTANVLPIDIEKCLGAGMDGHMGKPLRVEALAGVLMAASERLNSATASSATPLECDYEHSEG